MNRTITIAAAAIGLLAAGAVAVAATVPETGVPAANVTVITKNKSWPIKGLITMDPCAITACQEV